jgi:amino acid transporter
VHDAAGRSGPLEAVALLEERGMGSTLNADAPPGGGDERLAQGSLGLPSIVFLGLIGAGPAITIALNIAYGASLAGSALPLAFLIGSVAVFCVAIIVAQFSRHLPAAGAYFTYTSHGLGPEAGFFTGWVALLYGLVFPAIPTLILATLLPDYSNRILGFEIPWFIWVIGLLTIIWAAAFTGVKASVRLGVVLGSIELAIVVVLVVITIIRAGGNNSVTPFTLGGEGLSPILASLVFVFLSFAGFEGVADLAEEARHPRKNVGRAVILAVLGLAVLYTAAAYAGIVGFGGDAAALAGDANPFDTLIRQIADPLWIVLAFAFLNSGLGGGLAGMLIATRNLFAMGRAGVIPTAFGQVHPVHKTPANAVHFMFALSLILALGLGTWLGPGTAFALLGTTYTVAVLVMYLMSAVALPVYYRREQPSEFNVLLHILVPIVAAVVIVAALWSLVNPAPAEPIVYALPIAAVWMVIGIVLVLYLRAKRPDQLRGGRKIFVPEEAD